MPEIPRTYMLVSPTRRATLPAWSWPRGQNERIDAHASMSEQLMVLRVPFHQLNEVLAHNETAKLNGREEQRIPTDDERRRRALAARAQLHSIWKRINETVAKSVIEKEDMERSPFGTLDASPEARERRREMRDYARTLKPQERLALARKDPAFAAAVGDEAHYLSGMSEADWKDLRRQAAEERHGPHLERRRAEIAAAERALLAHKAISEAVEGEIRAVGEAQPLPSNGSAPREWSQMVFDTGE